MPQLGWIIDLTKCTGCHTCEVACKMENNTFPQLSPLPITSPYKAQQVNWRRVLEIESGTYPNARRSFYTMSCHHCEHPACMAACPAGAITKRSSDGVVLLDQSKCIGCKYCAAACPYGAPQFNEATGIMEKCTFCAHRLAVGEKPACVTACLGGALQFTTDFQAPGDVPPGFADPTLTNPSVQWIADTVRG
jgi:Fe-S-cluster-containing dehydrogenase component